MRFGQDFIERVQEANNLVDLISQYTQLKPVSGGFMGRCPFPDHSEKTASFSVSESKQVYNCFGCGKKGNIFTFLRDFNGLNFRDALEYLANRAHIPIPEDTKEDAQSSDLAAKKKKELMLVNKLAAQYFSECFSGLDSQHPTKIYAHKRGLNSEIINEFKIGFAPESWDGLFEFLKNKGVPAQLAEEARLIKSKKDGPGYFDIFRNRLMFPILNTMGEPIAFGGRVILQGEPKYLNSPETPVFIKGKVLYGLSQAAKYIRSEDYVLVVEGYMDVVSLAQSGIGTAVATMGTAMTPEHAKILGRMTKNIVALFDGDQAGLAAAERALPILLSVELHPKGLVLPDGMDPDDFIKAKGPEALKQLLTRAPDLFSLVLNQWTEGFRGEPSEKVQLCDRLSPLFAAMRDPRIKGLYFREVQHRLGVDEKWLLQALSQSKNSVPTRRPNEIFQSEEPKTVMNKNEDLELQDQAIGGLIRLRGAPKAELILIGLSLKKRAYLDELEKQNLARYLSHAGTRQLLEKIIEDTRQAPDKFDKLTGLLSTQVDTPEALIYASAQSPNLKVMSQSGDSQQEDELKKIEAERIESDFFRDCIRKVKDLSLQSEALEVQRQLKIGATPELMERLMKIQRDRMNLQNLDGDKSEMT